jgi:UDP-GlcNAc3NAcA epimerase
LRVRTAAAEVLTIVGARPQFVKAAPVSAKIRESLVLREFLVHTGQHYDVNMSDQQFTSLGLSPADVNLGIMGGQPGDLIGRMISALDALFGDRDPAVVLVYGDTNSTLAGAVAAANRDVPLVHVEAGLRSNDRRMPEERNRVLTDHLSELLFCPTDRAVENLAREGVTSGVHMVGDVMLDAFLQNSPSGPEAAEALRQFDLESSGFVLATMHRAESTASRDELGSRLDFLRTLASEHTPDARALDVVLPLHPRTRGALLEFGLSTDGIRILDPLDYRTFSALLSQCSLVVTDSGGVQKEAYFHRVPCVTLRSETEWPETIEAGWNRLWTHDLWSAPRREISDYGSGTASEAIVLELERFVTQARSAS